jgi:hypothetical protein
MVACGADALWYASAVRDVTDAVEAELDEISRLVAQHVLDGDWQAPARSPVLEAVLRHAVTALVHDVLARLRARSGLPETLLPEVDSLVELWVEGGAELAALADAYAVAQVVFWERFHAVVHLAIPDPERRRATIAAARFQMSSYCRRVSALLRATYDRAGGQLANASHRSRKAAVVRILDGRSASSDEVGYDLHGEHLALVSDDANLLRRLADRTGRELLQVQGGATPLTWWAWLGGKTRVPAADVRGLAAGRNGRGARLALGEPAAGIEGFRTSHRQALDAWRLVVALGDPVVRFADAALLVSAARDRDVARIFMARYLRGFDPPLCDTVVAYLTSGHNAVAAASRIRCSRRTVERRIHRAEALLGQPLRDCASDLLVAIRLSHLAVAEGWSAQLPESRSASEPAPAVIARG